MEGDVSETVDLGDDEGDDLLEDGVQVIGQRRERGVRRSRGGRRRGDAQREDHI